MMSTAGEAYRLSFPSVAGLPGSGARTGRVDRRRCDALTGNRQRWNSRAPPSLLGGGNSSE